MQGQGQKKHGFVFPKREELIDEIKCLDDEFEHVTLNLVKCHYNAVEDDIRKAFSEINLVKVKNYNKGSFQVIFQTRIDAIDFIKKCYDRKILDRRFFIKMGRQKQQVAEDWTAVGYVPKQFRQPKWNNKPRHNEEGHEHKDHERKPYQKDYHKREEGDKVEAEKVAEPQTQTEEVKVQEVKKVEEKKVEEKKPEEKKPQVKKEAVEHKVIPITDHNRPKKDRKQHTKKPQDKPEEKKVEYKKKVEQKKKPEQKKAEPVVEKAPQPEQPQDDGWHVVPSKKARGKK